MTGIIRPPRGRQNRVAKYSNSPRRPGRQQQQALTDAAQAAESVLDPDLDHHGAGDKLRGDEAGVAAAEEDGMVDAEAESELDDDVAAATIMFQRHAQHPHAPAPEQVDELSSAAAILANGGALLSDDAGGGGASYPPPPAHHDDYGQPPPQQQHDAAAPSTRTTLQMAHDSGYPDIAGESTLAKRLANEPGLRLAQQRRPEQALNLARRSNVEALFAHIAGQVVLAAPCKNCRKGHGPWTACVVIDGQMCGSCANCWFNASGARCSFHESQNPSPHPLPPHQQQSSQPGLQLHTAPPGLSQLSSAAGPLQNASPYQIPVSLPRGSPSMGQVDFGAALSLNDLTVRAVVDRAFAEVHAADKATRQLMLIEVQAKQLALSILARQDDLAASAEAAAAVAAVGHGEPQAGPSHEHEHEAPATPDMLGDEGEG